MQSLSNYKDVGDFDIIKMRNSYYSKIVGRGNECLKTIVGCKLTLRDVRHVDFHLNLISFKLDQ